jgi:hypothetical protein
VREGDGDLAEAHVGEHRAQHVSQGQGRDPAQLRRDKKKLRGELVHREAKQQTGSRSREWPHLCRGDPGRGVEPRRPHGEDEQGAERELESGHGVRERHHLEYLQWRRVGVGQDSGRGTEAMRRAEQIESRG